MQILIAIVGLVVLFFAARFIVEQVSTRPTNLGVTDGQLTACPSTPNCVSSQATRTNQRVAPLQLTVPVEAARNRIINIINGIERSTIVTQTENYIHAEFRSLMWGFVDDMEFYFDEANRLIHVRSAARLGAGDMNVNRNRVERIRQEFGATGGTAAPTPTTPDANDTTEEATPEADTADEQTD